MSQSYGALRAASAGDPPVHGHIAARIDRLPLTRVPWQLALLLEITWGFIIFDTDGIGARLYPFVWRPGHVIDVYQYAVIQALQVGAGILLGVWLMSWIADRHGRRPAILIATLLGGFCIWPFAYVTNFWGMVVLSIASTLGVGGIVATHAMIWKNRTMRTSNASRQTDDSISPPMWRLRRARTQRQGST